MASKKEVLVLAGEASQLLATIRTVKDELSKLQGLAASVQIGGGSVPKIIAGQSGADGLKTYYDAQAGNAERRVAAANARSTARGLADIDANAASPDTTPESRKDAAAARAAANWTRSTASYGQRWGTLTPQQVTQQMDARQGNSLAARELGAGIRERNATTAKGLFALAEQRQRLRGQAYADRKTAHGGQDDEEWAVAQAGRATTRSQEVDTSLGLRTGLEGARTTTLNARTTLVDAKRNLQGGSSIELLAARQADRGATQAEMIDKRREAAREREEIRKEKRKDRVADRAAAKQDAVADRMGGALLNLIPGGSAMQRLNGLFPGASARMGQFRGFLGQSVMTNPYASVGAGIRGLGGLGGGIMGPLAAGSAGLGAMAAGVVGGVGLAAGVGELGVHAARSLYAPSVGRLTNLEQQLSHGFGAGGVGRTSDWMQSQTTKRLMGQGFQQAGMAESYMAYVRSRGTRGGAGQDAFDSMETSMRYGVGGGLLGSLDASAGAGAGRRAVRGLYNSGLTGDALSDAMSGLGSTAARAASHGIKYNTDSYTNMSQNLSGNKAFGGGRNGGNLATQRLAGMGDSVMGGIESAMGSISDMAVFAQAAAGGGDITDIAHRLRGMTPEQKLAAQTKQLGRGNTKYGLVGQGFSPDQAAALAAYKGGQAGPGEEPPLFRMAYGTISGKKDYAMDLEASQKGSTAESIAQRDVNITLIAAKIVEIAGFVKSYANITKKGTSWFAE